MLKAFNPVVILLISFAFKIQEPNMRLIGVVAMISFGCCVAAYGELHFVLAGFLCQCIALCFEASRLVMIEILLHGMKVGVSPYEIDTHTHARVTDLVPLYHLLSDGSSCFAVLLCTRLCCHQLCLDVALGGGRALLPTRQARCLCLV